MKTELTWPLFILAPAFEVYEYDEKPVEAGDTDTADAFERSRAHCICRMYDGPSGKQME
jgi:hypothetical protein